MDLLTPMLADSPAHPEKKCDDDGWVAQRKFDGVRLLVHVDEGNVIPVNRKGETIPLPRDLRDAFAMFHSGQFAFDGEMLKSDFCVFDMPIAGSAVQPTMPYEHRLAVLEQFYTRWDPGPSFHLAETARTTVEKHHLAVLLDESGAEGMILKRLSGPYRPGVRSSDMIKYKFWHTADVFVTEIGREGKSNAVMAAYDENGKQVDLGTVSTLGKWAAKVDVGTVIEARYLYCVNRSRPHLVQPNIWRIRNDKSADECTTRDLHYTNKTLTVC